MQKIHLRAEDAELGSPVIQVYVSAPCGPWGQRGCAGAEGPIGFAGPQEGAQMEPGLWLGAGVGAGAGHHGSPE